LVVATLVRSLAVSILLLPELGVVDILMPVVEDADEIEIADCGTAPCGKVSALTGRMVSWGRRRRVVRMRERRAVLMTVSLFIEILSTLAIARLPEAELLVLGSKVPKYDIFLFILVIRAIL
jgi:hypothetical protein